MRGFKMDPKEEAIVQILLDQDDLVWLRLWDIPAHEYSACIGKITYRISSHGATFGIGLQISGDIISQSFAMNANRTEDRSSLLEQLFRRAQDGTERSRRIQRNQDMEIVLQSLQKHSGKS
jgi:hypothetical protein